MIQRDQNPPWKLRCGRLWAPLAAKVALSDFLAARRSPIFRCVRVGGSRMDVGVAGLGNMGSAIAGRLIESGNAVTVWNRSAEKCKPLAAAGAAVAASAVALAEAAGAVITILTDATAIDAVYGGPTGLLAGDIKDKLFVEMSTVPPHVGIELAERVRAKGAAFVECPVGGTTGPARQGKLIGLMGADPADRARDAAPQPIVPAH